MDTILVATDISERSDRAIERALHLASDHNAKCHVVSVVDDALPVEITDNLALSISQRLETLVNSAADGVETEVTVLRGETVEMLTRFAILHDADLTVLGMHRPRVFLDGFRETTMERLVTTSMVPVLLVRNEVIYSYHNALIPISFSPSCVAAISTVKKLVPAATVSSFHALQTPFLDQTSGSENAEMTQASKQNAAKVRDRWVAANALPDGISETEIVTGSVRLVMEEKLQELKPDLLAIGAHTRTGLAMRRLGAFAADLVRQPPVDLLISPMPRV